MSPHWLAFQACIVLHHLMPGLCAGTLCRSACAPAAPAGGTPRRWSYAPAHRSKSAWHPTNVRLRLTQVLCCWQPAVLTGLLGADANVCGKFKDLLLSTQSSPPDLAVSWMQFALDRLELEPTYLTPIHAFILEACALFCAHTHELAGPRSAGLTLAVHAAAWPRSTTEQRCGCWQSRLSTWTPRAQA